MSATEAPPVVLLIDDAPDIHRLLRTRLASEQILLMPAMSGQEGIEAARKLKPALILLDLNMPGMDGFTVLRTLKSDPELHQIAVIAVSSSDATDDHVMGLDLGAVDYVCKPFHMAELRARLRSALRIHELMQLLSQKAQVDGLTGLWNRSYFDARLGQELNILTREDRPLTMALCDLDHFKSLNDTFGHAASDAALQGFARIVLRHLRKSDVACRYGGEEFAIILRDTDAAGALTVLDRIRADLAAAKWPRHPERSITASFGVADRGSVANLLAQSWIETADKALYEAKKGGRNQIQVAGPSAQLAKAA